MQKERDGAVDKLRVLQDKKDEIESRKTYVSVCKEKDEIETDLKKTLVKNHNLLEALSRYNENLDKGIDIDKVSTY